MISNLHQQFVFEWEYDNKNIFLNFNQEPFVTVVNSNQILIICFEHTYKAGAVFFYQLDGQLINKIDPNNNLEISPQNIFYDNHYLYIKVFQKHRRSILSSLICKFFNISGISRSKLFFYKIDFNGKIVCLLNTLPKNSALKKSYQV